MYALSELMVVIHYQFMKLTQIILRRFISEETNKSDR